FDLLQRPRRDDDGSARLRERHRDRLADPAPAAGHDGGAPVQAGTEPELVHCVTSPSSAATTASSRIRPSAAIVSRPSSALADAGSPKYARGPPASSKVRFPSRIATESECGTSGSAARIVSRTHPGRSAMITLLSNRPAWHAPLLNSSVSRSAH